MRLRPPFIQALGLPLGLAFLVPALMTAEPPAPQDAHFIDYSAIYLTATGGETGTAPTPAVPGGAGFGPESPEALDQDDENPPAAPPAGDGAERPPDGDAPEDLKSFHAWFGPPAEDPPADRPSRRFD